MRPLIFSFFNGSVVLIELSYSIKPKIKISNRKNEYNIIWYIVIVIKLPYQVIGTMGYNLNFVVNKKKGWYLIFK